MGNRESNAPRIFGLLCVALACFQSSARAQLPHAQFSTVFPAGAKAGTRVVVQIDGADLDDAELLFSHPGITASPKTDASNQFDPEPERIPGQFMVNVADDVPPGIYEVCAAGYFGISNPRLFAVNHLSEVIAGSDHSRIESAQELPIDSVVNSRAAVEQIHHYRFGVRAGAAVLVECVAAQIDSRMDATLILWDSSGKELARVRDIVGRDPVLALAPDEETEYIVGVYDFTYGGGSEFVYRLAVHRRPRLWFAFPPVGTTGRTSAFSLYGWNLPGARPAGQTRIEDGPLERLDMAIRIDSAPQVVPLGPPQALFAAGVPHRVDGPTGSSDPLVIQQTELPVVIEGPSNDTPDSAEPIPIGCEYVGRLFPRSDVDWIKFAANSGDVIDINVLSDRIGATADPALTIEKVTFAADGQPQVHPVATVDDSRPKQGGGIGRLFDTGSADPSYRLVADELAFYRVGVRDVYGNPRGDPRRIYRLVVRRPEGDYRLVAFAEPPRAADRNLAPLGSAVLRKGGTAVLTVCLDRLGGFDGDVEVTAVELPDGVTCTPVVLGSHADRAPLVLAADESAPAFGGTIRVVGCPITDAPGPTKAAQTAFGGTVVWPGNYAQQPVPTRITSSVRLAVVGCDPVPVSIHVGNGKVLETSPGGKLSVPVKVVRRDGFAAELDVAALGLPGGFQANNIRIKEETGTLELFAAQPSIRPGNYTVLLRTATKAKLVRNAEAIRRAEARKAHFDQARTRAVALETSVAVALAAQQAAEATQVAAEKVATQTEAVRKRLEDLVGQANKRLEEVKGQNGARDYEFEIISRPVQIRVDTAPVDVELTSDHVVLAQARAGRLGMRIRRKHGFTGNVIIQPNLPSDMHVKAQNVTINQDQQEAQLDFAAEANAVPGTHACVATARLEHNGVSVRKSVPFTLVILPSAGKNE